MIFRIAFFNHKESDVFHFDINIYKILKHIFRKVLNETILGHHDILVTRGIKILFDQFQR